MSDTYILIGQTPVPEPDTVRWGQWFEAADRRVDSTQVGPFRVSTVFLGLDHQFGSGPPLLFESMIFLDGHEEAIRGSYACEAHRTESTIELYCTRCSTWLEAEQMHYKAMQHAQAMAMELRSREKRKP